VDLDHGKQQHWSQTINMLPKPGSNPPIGAAAHRSNSTTSGDNHQQRPENSTASAASQERKAPVEAGEHDGAGQHHQDPR
jgi:hypothetical protein